MGKKYFAGLNPAVKKIRKKALKGAKKLAIVLLFIIAIAYFAVGNMVVLATAVIWMPLAFFFQPTWLARKISKKQSDDPTEFFREIRLASTTTIGIFFRWLGTRSWCMRKQRFAFLKECSPVLKDYPTKVQVQYWEDCYHRENSFKFLSEDARVAILDKLLYDERYGIILNHIDICTAYEKGKFIRSLIAALQVRKSQMERTTIFKFIAQNYGSKHFNLSMLKEEEFEYLWNSISSMKLLVLHTRGMNMEYIRRMIKNENMPEGEGRKLLERYIENKTLSSQQLSYLISEAVEDDDVVNILDKIIIKHGLTPQLLYQVYETKNDGFVSHIVEKLAIFTDRQMIKSVTDMSCSENEQRWKKYCTQREISQTAQMEMSYEQYKAFRASGQKLGKQALEWLVVNLSNQPYFREVISDEYEMITDKLRALISTVDWKLAILVDLTDKKSQA